MSTFLQMRTKIADYLDRSDLTDQIKDAINRAIEYYEKERFWFNEKVGTFATVANTKNYGSAGGVPTDIAEIDYVEVTQSGKEYELKPRTFDYIKQRQGYDPTGLPTDYAFYQENFYLNPVPNGIYTITISYQQKYTALSADADTNDFTTDAEDLIEARSRWWLYKNVIKDREEADLAKQDELDALNSLREKTRKLIATGYVKPTCF